MNESMNVLSWKIVFFKSVGGNWQYLILVRDGKDSDWSVIHYGGSYKE